MFAKIEAKLGNILLLFIIFIRITIELAKMNNSICIKTNFN